MNGGKMGDKRSFKLVEVDGNAVRESNQGRYTGVAPEVAAEHAFRQLCLRKKGDKCSHKFFMAETTRGSKKKVYGPYKGEQKLRPKPLKFKRGKDTIVSKYQREVRLVGNQKGGRWAFST